MSSKQDTAEIITTPEGVLLFPTVFDPKGIPGKASEPFYSASLLLTPEAVKEVWAACCRVARAYHGADADIKSMAMPIRSGSVEKQKAEAKGKDGSFYEGKFVLYARSDFAPRVLNIRGELIQKGLSNASLVRSGNYAYFEVKFQAKDASNFGPAGVKAYLNRILISREGTPIAGRTDADAFAGIITKHSAQDVSTSAAGGVPGLDDIPS